LFGTGTYYRVRQQRFDTAKMHRFLPWLNFIRPMAILARLM
jgi:hypothetical protein